MKHYMIAAVKGFRITGLLSTLAWTFLGKDFCPWERGAFLGLVALFAFTGAVLASFPLIFADMISGRHIWKQRTKRSIGVLLAGAFFGLFVLGWVSLLGPNEFTQFKTPQLLNFLCCCGLECNLNLMLKARELYQDADFLAKCKFFLDNSMWYAYGSAGFAFAALSFQDLVLQKWLNAVNGEKLTR